MLGQPPLTVKEVFGRGLVEGLAVFFFTFLLSLVSMLPSRKWLYLGPSDSLGQTLLFVWPFFGIVGCATLLFGRKARTAWYRAGVLASCALFLGLIAVIWVTIR